MTCVRERGREGGREGGREREREGGRGREREGERGGEKRKMGGGERSVTKAQKSVPLPELSVFEESFSTCGMPI